MATFSEIAFKLAFETGDAYKSLESLKELAIKTGVDITTGINNADKALLNYAKNVAKLAQEEEKAKQQSIKTLEQESKLRQQLAKESEQAAKRAADAEKRANAERQAEAKKLADFKKTVDQELAKAALSDAEKLIEIERKKAELAKGGAEKNSKEVRKVLEEEAKLKEAMYKREAEMVEALYQEKLATLEKGSDEWVKIEQERLKRVLDAEKKASGEAEKARKADEGPKGRNFDEVAENFSTLTDSLTSGNIAGAAAGIGQMFGDLGGKIGGVAGVIADQIFSIIGGLSDLAKAAVETDEAWTRFSVTFNDTDLSAQSIKQIQVELQAIARPAGVSEQALAELATTVAGFEEPEGIADTTAAILDLEAVSGGMDVGAITDGVGQFGTALKDGALAADLFAEAQISVTGSGASLGETMQGITKTFSTANIAIKDTATAGKESSTVFAALTQTGLKATEAGAAGAEVFKTLGKVVSDPKMLDALTKQLPEGVTAVDAGLVKGDVSVTKFAKTLADMGDAGLQVAASLGGKTGESIQQLVKGAQTGAIDIDKLTASFDNAAGAAGRYATLLTPISKVQNELAEQRSADAMTNLGRAFSDLADTGAGFFNTMLDGLADVGGPLADLFIDSAVEAERANQAYEAVRDQATAFAGLVDELSGLEGPEFIDQLNASMEALEASAPGTAAEIQRIQSTMAEPGTAEYAAQLEQINGLLQEASEIKAGETFVALNEAIDASLGRFEDLASESEGWFDSWGGFAANVLELGSSLGLVLGDTSDAVAGLRRSFSEVTADADANVASIRDQIASLKERQAAGTLDSAGTAELLQLNAQLGTALKEQVDARGRQNAATEEALNLAGTLADQAANLETVEDKRVFIQSQLADVLKGQPDIYQTLMANMDGIIAGEEFRVGLNGQITSTIATQNEEVAEQATLESDLSAQTSDRAEYLKSIGVQEKQNTDQKLNQLKAESVAQDQLIAQVDAQLAAVEAVLQGRMTEGEAIDVLAQKQAAYNQIVADQKRASETGEATVSANLPALTAESSMADFQAFKEGLLESRKALVDQKEAIDSSISGLQETQSKEMDASAKKAESEEKGAAAVDKKADAEDKAADALQKSRDAIAKANAKGAAQDRKNASESQKAAQKRREESDKAAKELANAIRAAAQEISQFANQSLMKAAQEIDSTAKALGMANEVIVSAVQEVDQRLGQQSEELALANRAQADALAKQIEDKRKEIAALERDIAQKRSDANEDVLVSLSNVLGSDLLRGVRRRDLAPDSQEISKLIANLSALQAEVGPQKMLELARTVGLSMASQLPEFLRNLTTATQTQAGAFADALNAVRLGFGEDLAELRNALADPLAKIRELNADILAIQSRTDATPTGTGEAATAAGAQAFGALSVSDKLRSVTQTAAANVKELTDNLMRASTALDTLGTDATGVSRTFNEIWDSSERAVNGLDLSGLKATLATVTDEASAEIGRLTKEVEAAQAKVDSAGSAESQKRAIEDRDIIQGRIDALQSAIDGATYVVDKAVADAAYAQELLASGYESALSSTEGIAEEIMGQAQAARDAERDSQFNTDKQRVEAEIETQQKLLAIRKQGLQDAIELEQARLAKQVELGDAGAADTQAKIDGYKNSLISLEQAEGDLAATAGMLTDQAESGFEMMFGSKRTEQIMGVASAIASATDAVGGLIKGLQDAESGLDVIDTGADLAQKVGQALLNAPIPPLQIAGAVLVGGALIAKAITGIIRLFQSEELTQKERAENEIARQEKINSLYEKRKALLEATIALGDATVDQAHEQLAVETRLFELKLSQLKVDRELLNMDSARLNAASERNIEELNAAEATLEKLQNLSGSFDKDYLAELGVESGGDINKAIEARMDELEASIILLEAEGEQMQAVMEYQKLVLDYEKAILDERLKVNQLRIRLGADEKKMLEANEKLLRDQLANLANTLIFSDQTAKSIAQSMGVMDSKGFGTRFAQMTKDQIQAFLDALAAAGIMSGELVDAANAWLAGADAVDQFNASLDETEDLFDKLKTRLGLLKDLGRISDQEFQDEMLTLLEERLAFLDAEREALIEAGASSGELLDNEIARLGIEKEIEDLLNKQNGELAKGDALTVKLVRERQRLLAAIRQQTGGGALNPAQQAQLDAATQAAVARMQEIGVPQEEIDKFLASLPKYEEGGFIAYGGPKLLHPGEFVLPATAVNAIGRDELERFLSNSPSNLENSLAGRYLTANGGTSGGSNVTINFNGITVQVQGSISDSAAQTMGNTIVSGLAREVQRLIDSGEVRVGRG